MKEIEWFYSPNTSSQEKQEVFGEVADALRQIFYDARMYRARTYEKDAETDNDLSADKQIRNNARDKMTQMACAQVVNFFDNHSRGHDDGVGDLSGIEKLNAAVARNSAAGLPGPGLPHLSPMCKAQLGLALLMAAVYDEIHDAHCAGYSGKQAGNIPYPAGRERLGQIIGAKEIARRIGLALPKYSGAKNDDSKESLYDSFGPFVVSVIGRCLADETDVEYEKGKGFSFPMRIY